MRRTEAAVRNPASQDNDENRSVSTIPVSHDDDWMDLIWLPYSPRESGNPIPPEWRERASPFQSLAYDYKFQIASLLLQLAEREEDLRDIVGPRDWLHLHRTALMEANGRGRTDEQLLACWQSWDKMDSNNPVPAGWRDWVLSDDIKIMLTRHIATEVANMVELNIRLGSAKENAKEFETKLAIAYDTSTVTCKKRRRDVDDSK